MSVYNKDVNTRSREIGYPGKRPLEVYYDTLAPLGLIASTISEIK